MVVPGFGVYHGVAGRAGTKLEYYYAADDFNGQWSTSIPNHWSPTPLNLSIAYSPNLPNKYQQGFDDVSRLVFTVDAGYIRLRHWETVD